MIYRFDLATTVPGTGASPDHEWLSGLNGPTHLAIGPDGLLYFSELLGAVGEKISRVDPEAASPVPEVLVLFPDTDNINPEGIAFDADGYMYFTTQITGQVLRIDMTSVASFPVNYADAELLFSGLNSPGGVGIGTEHGGELVQQQKVAVGSEVKAESQDHATGAEGD